MIPFAGILFPALVLLVFQVWHPSTPQEETAAEGEPWTETIPRSAVTAPRPARPPDREPIVVDSAQLVWLRNRLRESDIFEALTDDELSHIAAISRRQVVTAGERLAEGGSRGETLFVVLHGTLRLLTDTAPEVPIRTAQAGEAVPLAVIIEPPVLVTSIEAALDGEVISIPRKRLLEVLEKRPAIGMRVYRAAAKAFEHRYRTTLVEEYGSDESHN
jgi:hypothetical protein